MSKKLCECGCGREVAKPRNRFIIGHNVRISNPTDDPEVRGKLSASHIGFKTGENHPFYGKHHTEETKKKISNALKNPSLETRRKMSIANRGRHHTEESKRKISVSHIGLQIGENNPMYGKHHSDETKERISKVAKGRKISLETRRKLSIAKCGENNPNYGKPPHKGAGRSKGSFCKKGHWVRSTWERNVADFLYKNNIEYEYEPERFVFNNSIISYLPDFYLPYWDLYIEVKGYMRSKNKIQHKLFERRGYNLLVIDKNLYPDFEKAIIDRNNIRPESK